MKSPVAVLAGLATLLLASCAGAPRDVTDPTCTPVFYNLQLKIHAGQQDAFRTLMREMVEATKGEPGTLVYEWYLAADGRTCEIHEHFADTAAYRAHGDNFRTRFAARFMPLLEITGLTVYGNADAAAREMLAGMQPVYLDAIGGFRR